MANVEKMVDSVRNFLDMDEWKYEYDPGMQIIRTGINLKCKLQSCRLIIRFSEDGYTVYATIAMNADESCRANVAEFITRANYGLKNGNFEMDFNDGEIRYKIYTRYEGLDDLPKEIIENSISVPALMFQRYGDGLATILFGFSTPAEVIKSIEG